MKRGGGFILCERPRQYVNTKGVGGKMKGNEPLTVLICPALSRAVRLHSRARGTGRKRKTGGTVNAALHCTFRSTTAIPTDLSRVLEYLGVLSKCQLTTATTKHNNDLPPWGLPVAHPLSQDRQCSARPKSDVSGGVLMHDFPVDIAFWRY